MKLEKWKNKWKEWSNLRKWQIWKLKLIDARLYFVSIFVGLLTGLVAVPYHYLLWYFFDVRKTFFTASAYIFIQVFRIFLVLACIVVFYLMGDSDFCRFFGKTYAIDSRRRYSSDTCGQ